MTNNDLKTKSVRNININVEEIVQSIKTKIYLEDRGLLDKRISHIRNLFFEYAIPGNNERSFIFKIWPMCIFYTLFFRFIRKVYFKISMNQREAISLLIAEVESLHLAITYLVEKEMKSDKKEK